MTQAVTFPTKLPNHMELPEEDGSVVKNFQEHPQSIILTDSIGSVMKRLHPDGQYAIGQDSGIYWRLTDPPERGCEAPDWFYIPNVPPLLDGQYRRSYVLWQEHIQPSVVLEFASGDGTEERDNTPLAVANGTKKSKPGKYWVYEQVMRIPYYGIFSMSAGTLEVYHLQDMTYRKLTPNDRGHYPIPPLEVELGLWEGNYQNQHQKWLRWWDNQGNLLLTGEERAALAEERVTLVQQERDRATQEATLAQQERDRATERAEQAEQNQREAISRLANMGLNSAQIAEALNLSVEEVRAIANIE
ncbi:Uma2 family endonuclease [Roseofilum sp. BLCC_M154]|uniref:Uma2 family endonuclease n=1 Tax=Roseofilum acuticapitatum BLCC-M154 TaxID=3022444 RepID=A0ABT7AVA8_9CYAN|nr:Uma2 family endonuclease [Roseofilum acuticapitatum]MDJ1170851.1 Uma2 family endonuclease [Roseofilum acuticapitatum BLCC-M154]